MNHFKNSLALLLSLFLIAESRSQEERGNRDVGKELIRQWIVTEKQLIKEKDDWRKEKNHLSELLDLYEKELKILDEELAVVGSVKIDDERKQELEREIKEGDEKRKLLRKFLIGLKPRMVSLVKKFPDPLQDELLEVIVVLNADDANTSTREMLMTMLAVIEAGNSFHSGVYRTSEKIRIGDDEWQAEVMYLGLSRAYFWVGDKAGVGSPSSAAGVDGWKWERADANLAEIKKAMAVFDKIIQPELIRLPLKIESKLK